MPRKASKYTGHEEVIVDDDLFLFKADFSFLASLKETAGVDPLQIFSQFSHDQADPELVCNVLECSILEKNGQAIDPTERRTMCEQLITANGLQECWALAQHLLSYGMLGDVKKRAARRLLTTQEIREAIGLSGSPLMIVIKQLSVWAYLLLISGACALLNFKIYENLT